VVSKLRSSGGNNEKGIEKLLKGIKEIEEVEEEFYLMQEKIVGKQIDELWKGQGLTLEEKVKLAKKFNMEFNNYEKELVKECKDLKKALEKVKKIEKDFKFFGIDMNQPLDNIKAAAKRKLEDIGKLKKEEQPIGQDKIEFLKDMSEYGYDKDFHNRSLKRFEKKIEKSERDIRDHLELKKKSREEIEKLDYLAKLLSKAGGKEEKMVILGDFAKTAEALFEK